MKDSHHNDSLRRKKPPKKDNNGIIFLTEEASPRSEEADEIIDLVDVVEDPPEDLDESIKKTDFDLPPLAEDDEIINLTDEVREERTEAADRTDIENSIRLTEIVGKTVARDERESSIEPESVQKDSDELETSLNALFDEGHDEIEVKNDDLASSLGLDLSAGTAADIQGKIPAQMSDAPGELPVGDVVKTDIDAISPSPRQLESALENVIHKIYAEKIENLLVEMVGVKVTAEIKKLKELLLADEGGEAQ